MCTYKLSDCGLMLHPKNNFRITFAMASESCCKWTKALTIMSCFGIHFFRFNFCANSLEKFFHTAGNFQLWMDSVISEVIKDSCLNSWIIPFRADNIFVKPWFYWLSAFTFILINSIIWISINSPSKNSANFPLRLWVFGLYIRREDSVRPATSRTSVTRHGICPSMSWL